MTSSEGAAAAAGITQRRAGGGGCVDIGLISDSNKHTKFGAVFSALIRMNNCNLRNVDNGRRIVRRCRRRRE